MNKQPSPSFIIHDFPQTLRWALKTIAGQKRIYLRQLVIDALQKFANEASPSPVNNSKGELK